MGVAFSELCCCFDRDKKVIVPHEQYKDNFNKYNVGCLIHDALETLVKKHIVKK